MKHKTLLVTLLLICALFCTFGLAACGSEHEDIPIKPHRHIYVLIDAGNGTDHIEWCEDPDCTDPYGSMEKHNWDDDGICKICGTNGYDLGYIELHKHIFDTEVVLDEYIAVEATCTKKAKYYYSCECGEKGNETFELDNDIYGDHSYKSGACEFCGATEGLKYNYNYSGGSNVTGIGTATGADIVIASTYNGYPVTAIESHAFSGCDGLTSVTIPDSVTWIGDFAFSGCINLTGITIPDSVTHIGSEAFSYSGLISITIPESVTTIYSGIIANCDNLSSITVSSENTKYHSAGNCIIETESRTLVAGCKASVIPTDGSVTSIGGSAFFNCRNLKNIAIPKSVTSIASTAFYGCTGLTSITIPDSVTSIGNSAFANCDNLASVTLGSGTADVDIGRNAFENCDSLKNITIIGVPASIGNNAFKDCPIETAKIPESAAGYIGKNKLRSLTITTDVSENVFANCAELQSVTVDGSVGKNGFKDCANLISVTVGGWNVGESAFEGCGRLSSVTFDDDVESIGYSAFCGCTSLTSITIPNSVTSIGNHAFADCTSLKGVTIGNGVMNIFPNIFNGCISLTNITVYSSNRYYSTHGGVLYDKNKTQIIIVPKGLVGVFVIPEDVTSIGSDAFYGCVYLTDVTILDSVTSIKDEDDPFLHCDSLCNISVSKSNPSYCVIDGILYDKAQTKIISIPTLLAGKVSIPNGVTQIYSRSFEGRNGLTEINFPDSLTLIGGSAFKDCTGLMSVTIPNSVTVVGAEAFSGCSRLMIYCEAESEPSDWHSDWNDSRCPVIWDYKNTNKDSNGYEYAVIDGIRYQFKDGIATVYKAIAASEDITIPASITYNDTEYGVTSIGDRAFADCTGLTSITISDSVTNIGFVAFEGCSKLTSITFNGTKEQWKAINKDATWDSDTGDYTVHCSDGDIVKS